jgi:hypothetical protein
MSAQPIHVNPKSLPPIQQATPLPVDPAERERQIREARARLVQLTDAAKEIEDEQNEIKAWLRGALGVGDHKATYGLSIYETKRFNAEKARDVLRTQPNGEALITSISETVISGKLAEKVLPPVIYDLCKVVAGKPTVKL